MKSSQGNRRKRPAAKAMPLRRADETDSETDKKDKQQEGLIEKMAKAGLSAMTTNAVMGAVAEGVMAADLPEGGEVIDDLPPLDGEILSGPAEGGGFLERPIAGGLADASLEQSLEIEYGQNGSVVPTEGSGSMVVNGYDIEVLQYMPGADMAKLAMGQSLDAADGLSLLMEKGIHAGSTTEGKSQQSDNASSGSSSSSSGGDSSSDTTSTGSTSDGHDASKMLGDDGLMGQSRDSEVAIAEERREEKDKEIAIEREALEIEHKAELHEAMRTQDLGQAETERTGPHGTIRMQTQFEARNPDEELEQKKGEDHVTEAIRTPHKEVQYSKDQIALYTIMQEQEKDRDQGLSLR